MKMKMMRTWILTAVATILVLAACTVTVSTPFPPDDTTPITAYASEVAISAGSFAFQSGETRWFEVQLTETAQSQEALFLELNTESSVQLTLYSSGGTALASTTGANAFFKGTTGLTSASTPASEVSPASLTEADVCEGACVIRDASSSTFYVRIRNGGGDRSISIYAYARAYYDDGETANDSQANAVPLASGEFDSGAIESIGDVDYWEMMDTGDLHFSAYSGAPDIERRVLVIFGSGTEGPYSEADSPITVVAGDIVAVYEAGDDAAGPAGFSGYTLELNPVP